MDYSDYGLNYHPQKNINAAFVLKQEVNMNKDVILQELRTKFSSIATNDQF